jgi:hypothetical protein
MSLVSMRWHFTVAIQQGLFGEIMLVYFSEQWGLFRPARDYTVTISTTPQPSVSFCLVALKGPSVARFLGVRSTQIYSILHQYVMLSIARTA